MILSRSSSVCSFWGLQHLQMLSVNLQQKLSKIMHTLFNCRYIILMVHQEENTTFQVSQIVWESMPNQQITNTGAQFITEPEKDKKIQEMQKEWLLILQHKWVSKIFLSKEFPVTADASNYTSSHKAPRFKGVGMNTTAQCRRNEFQLFFWWQMFSGSSNTNMKSKGKSVDNRLVAFNYTFWAESGRASAVTSDSALCLWDALPCESIVLILQLVDKTDQWVLQVSHLADECLQGQLQLLLLSLKKEGKIGVRTKLSTFSRTVGIRTRASIPHSLLQRDSFSGQENRDPRDKNPTFSHWSCLLGRNF